MELHNVTLNDVIEAVSQQRDISGAHQSDTFTPHIGRRCIVRTYASGVFCGIVVAQSGRQVELRESRRMWRWQAAESISLSSVAVNGVDPSKCRFPETVEAMTVLDALEIIPATPTALATIDACKVAEQS